MKKLYITTISLTLLLIAQAQSFEWAKFMRTYAHFSTGNRMATDNAGNVYVCGEFRYLLTIDGDTLSTPSLYNDLSLSKFSPTGTLIWNKQFGNCYIDFVRQMAVDDAGHIYVSIGGSQCDSITFEDTTILIPYGSHQLLQFDNNGKYLRHQSGTNTIHVATLGNDVYTTRYDVVTKLDSLFNIQWSRTMSMGGYFYLSSTGHSGDLYVSRTGRLVMTGFEGQPGTIMIDTLSMTFNGGFNDIAILVMDTSGSALWARILPATNQIPLATVACAADDIGNVYWGTQMGDLLQFGSSTLSNPYILNYSALLKYDASGNEQWAVGLYPNNSPPVLHDIVINSQQEAVIAAEYSSYSAVGSFGGIPLPSAQNSPIISKLDPSGNVVWIKTHNAITNNSASAHSIALMPGDKIAVAGQVYDIQHFGCFTSPQEHSNLVAIINENPEPVPVAGFEYVNEGGNYFFHNTITNGGNSSWNFGDGNTSTQGNPTHSFGIGAYNVCLTSTNNCGTDTYCDTIVVPGINRVTPNHIANSGFNLVYIEGGFNFSSATVTFRMGGNTIAVDSVLVVNEGLIRCKLILNASPIGLYDVIVSSGGFSDTLFQSLYIEAPTPENTEITIGAYRHKHLINTHRLYNVTLVNHSNQTLIGVPFHVILDGGLTAILKTAIDADSIEQMFVDSTGHFGFYTDTLANKSYRVGYFMVSFLEPEKPFSFEFYLRPQSFAPQRIQAFVGSAQYDSSALVDMGLRAACTQLPKCIGCIFNLASMNPSLANCANGAANMACQLARGAGSAPTTEGAVNSVVFNIQNAVAATFFECVDQNAIDALEFAAWTSIEGSPSMGNGSVDGGLGTPFGSGCELFQTGGCDPLDEDDWDLRAVASLDPNGKSGPQGFTPENYINNKDLIEYSVYFENADTAQVPATSVEIFDTLDVSKFEMSTFRFSAFGFADTSFTIHLPDYSFARDIDLRPAKNSILRVMASLDTATGILKWGFYSLDTLTLDLNPDPDQGFLNPNVTSPEGEGYVSYSVLPKQLAHGTTILNRAKIVFDDNEPLITPYWTNTIDLVLPQSQVTIIQNSITDTTFTLHFNGTDAHAGVHLYEVYASKDTSVFHKVGRVTEDSIIIHGQSGVNYKFYSVAVDHAGNRETTPGTFDAQVTVPVVTNLRNQAQALNSMHLYPNPFSEQLTVVLGANTQITVSLYDFLGQQVLQQTFANSTTINTEQLADGIYFYELCNDKGTLKTGKVVKQ